MSFEEEIEKFYKNVLETWSFVNTFIKNVENFQEVWGFKYDSVDTCRLSCDEAKREIDNLKSRFLRKTLKCVITGKSSSGKSTLLNSLLLDDVLPSGFDCKTNCFIEVKKSCKSSPNRKNYILVGDEEKSLESLKDLADKYSNDALPQGSHIELFFTPLKDSLLNHNIVIMDTPGFDDLSELDNVIEEKCSDADVLILVVSSVTGPGEAEKKFISHNKTMFSKLNIIFLYSYWDMMQTKNIERSNKNRIDLLNKAQQFLEKDISLSTENIKERIFFIASTEKLASLCSLQDNPNLLTQSRNEEYDKFLTYLKANISTHSRARRLNIAHHFCKIFDSIFRDIQNCINEIKNQKGVFGVLSDFNDKVNNEVELIFKDSYNQFFDKGLELINNDVSLSDQDIKDNLNYILQELIVVLMESIKIRIRGLVDNRNITDYEHCINILESFYFPFFSNLKRHINSFEIFVLYQSFLEINQVKKIGSRFMIGGAAISTAATFVTGGILAIIMLPIEIFLGTTGAAVGGAAGGNISNAIISGNREAFCFFYKKHEGIMKELWKNMQDDITNSFEKFIGKISIRLDIVIEPLEKEFDALSNKINNLSLEGNDLRNSI